MRSQFTVRIVWGDCDEQGIVFYPNYFYWMDSAFQALLRDAGHSIRSLREQFGIAGVPIVEANARFLSSASHEETLSINAEIRHWGETSLRVEYSGYCGERPIFEGFEARVWLKRSNNGAARAAAIPDVFKNAFLAS
ncbi:MAG TPA: thioesterase family protein [Xanthobacteraceae bacterium]|nr:thioesterase family protein [Xanthobacteraceae bacterium]